MSSPVYRTKPTLKLLEYSMMKSKSKINTRTYTKVGTKVLWRYRLIASTSSGKNSKATISQQKREMATSEKEKIGKINKLMT